MNSAIHKPGFTGMVLDFLLDFQLAKILVASR